MLLFWEKGYDETSIGDLTAAMGIAAPSLYAAFGDKRRLFEEAVELYEREPNGPVPAGLAEPTARDAVERMLAQAAVEYTAPDQPAGCFITSEPLLGERRAATREAIRSRLRAEGVPDADRVAAFVSAVLAGMSSLARDGATREELDAVAETALGALRLA